MSRVHVKLSSFDDLAYLVFTGLTAYKASASIICAESRCFVIATTGEKEYIYSSPKPEKVCRFVSMDDNGKIMCSDTPFKGRPYVLVISAEGVEDVEDISSVIK